MRPFLRLASGSSLRRSLPRGVSTFARSSAYHAQSSASRVGVGIGAVALTGYIGWHLSSTQNRIFADTSAAATPPPSKTLVEHEPLSKVEVEKIDIESPLPSDETAMSQTITEGDPPSNTEGEHPPTEVAHEGGEKGDSSESAFNPVTGEINWGCPCLGGMADGPCGPEFREAFSCFVYSEGEPKGIECVGKFKGMQDCFRLHPEIYAEEIDDDDDDATLDAADPAGVPTEALAFEEDHAGASSPASEEASVFIPDPVPTPTPKPPIVFEPVTFDAPESAPPPKKPSVGKARALAS